MKKRFALICAVLCACVLLTGCAEKSAVVMAQLDVQGNAIVVSATGSVSVQPNVAYVSLGVESVATTADGARKANETSVKAVYTALEKLGLKDTEIVLESYYVWPRYDCYGADVVGYSVTSTLRVQVTQLDKLSDVLSAAAQAGANTSNGLYFDVLDRANAYDDALELAVTKSKDRADVLARSSGVKLGRIRSIEELGSYDPMYMNYGDGTGTAPGDKPLQPGRLQVDASIRVTFEINN